MPISPFVFAETTPKNFQNVGTDGGGNYFPLVFPQATTAGSTLVVFAGKNPQNGAFSGNASDLTNGAYTQLDSLSITPPNALWNAWVFQNAASVGQGCFSAATSGSTTSLTDTTQAWTTNQWAGLTLIDLISNLTYTVTSNSATVLNFPAGTAPNSGDFYVVGPFVRIPVANAQAFGDYTGGCAIEITGAALSGGIAHSANFNTVGSSGTDNVTSGAVNCGSVPGNMISVCINANGASSPFAPASGTGFTDKGAFFAEDNGQTTVRVESRHFSSAPGTVGATYSSPGADQYGALMVFAQDINVGSTATLSWIR